VEPGKSKGEKPLLGAERPKSEKPLEPLLLERGAILLPQGVLQIEPSLEYTRYSSERVAVSGLTVFEAIAIGRVSVDKLSRDLYTAAVTARYGLLDRLQVDMRIPYMNRQDKETIGTGVPGAIDHNTHGSDIGDIDASLMGQALRGQEAIPGVILRLRGRFPTGTHAFEIPTEVIAGNTRLKEAPTGAGYYSVAPGFTLTWRSDPVVFFSGANYSFNLERTFGTRGTVNAGDTVEIFLGLAVAVNERIGLNMSFLDGVTGSTKVNGVTQSGTAFNDGRLILGTSIVVSPTSTVSVSAGAGLTRESPDFTLTIGLPTTLKLF
jgi:hypothetical protein